ncbi:MAG TPA: hypothetical protein VLA31_05450 [Burkholderiaceae bacterium]|nr:hypothetical protein [Burkholderiaceae bacterium]
MEQKQPDLSWTQIGLLWVVAIALWGVFWRVSGCNSRRAQTPEQKAEAEAWAKEENERHEKLKRDLDHPLVNASFKAGYGFGVEHKNTGLTKLTERELDAYGLAACSQLKVPRNLQGHAMRAFKDGYGWGWFNGK